MKKILGLFIALLFFSASFASGSASMISFSKPVMLNAAEIFIPIGKNGQKVSLLDISKMKIKEFEALSGHKMKLSEKIKFKLGQKSLVNSINPDNTINSKKLTSLKPSKKGTEKSKRYFRLFLIFLLAAIVLFLIGLVTSFFAILGTIVGIGAVIFFILYLIELSK